MCVCQFLSYLQEPVFLIIFLLIYFCSSELKKLKFIFSRYLPGSPLRNEWANEEKEGVGRLAQAPSCSLPQNQSPDWHNLRLALSCPGSKSLWQLCHLRNRAEFPLSSSGCTGGSIPMTLGQGAGDRPELPLAPYTHHSLQPSQVWHIRIENSH